MCPPDHFEIAYVINPWMEGHFANTDDALAHRQWNGLRNAIEQHAKLALETPQRDLPDIVFTANAGIVLGKKVIVSRFRSIERRGEEPHHRAWFAENGFEILDWPQDIPFEGAGDALFDRGQDLLWVGHGFRSDAAVPTLLEKLLGRKTAALNLVDPRFYHLDTCLCPLAGGFLLYFPAAFDEKSRALIELLAPQGKRIAAQLASVRTSITARIAISLYGGGVPPFRVGSRVTTYGTQINNARGKAVVPTASGGTASVTEMTASTSENHYAFLPGFQPATDTSITPTAYVNIGIGVGAATEDRIGTWWYGKTTGEDMSGPFPWLPSFVDVPAGSRLSMLASNQGANDAAYDGLIYAIS